MLWAFECQRQRVSCKSFLLQKVFVAKVFFVQKVWFLCRKGHLVWRICDQEVNQEAAQDVILVLGSYSGLRESVRSFFFSDLWRNKLLSSLFQLCRINAATFLMWRLGGRANVQLNGFLTMLLYLMAGHLVNANHNRNTFRLVMTRLTSFSTQSFPSIIDSIDSFCLHIQSPNVFQWKTVWKKHWVRVLQFPTQSTHSLWAASVQ